MFSIIYSTTGNIEESRKIARILVEEKLVACVNIIPKIDSVYRWKGKIEEDNESVILAKTKDENVKKTIQRIREIHSYETPDIVALKIDKGLKKYLDWIVDETL